MFLQLWGWLVNDQRYYSFVWLTFLRYFLLIIPMWELNFDNKVFSFSFPLWLSSLFKVLSRAPTANLWFMRPAAFWLSLCMRIADLRGYVRITMYKHDLFVVLVGFCFIYLVRAVRSECLPFYSGCILQQRCYRRQSGSRWNSSLPLPLAGERQGETNRAWFRPDSRTIAGMLLRMLSFLSGGIWKFLAVSCWVAAADAMFRCFCHFDTIYRSSFCSFH